MDYANNRRDVILRLPELYFWFSGLAANTMFTTSAGTTVSSDGVNIGLWRSVVGNCELSQSTAGNRPVLQALNDTNELGVYFNASTLRLTGNAALCAFTQSAKAATCISTVLLPAAGGVSKRLFQISRNASGSTRFSSLVISGDLLQHQTRRLDADSPSTNGSGSTTYSSGTIYIRFDSVDPVSGNVVTELYHPSTGLASYVNATASWTAGATFDTTASTDVTLGGNPAADPFTDGIYYDWIGTRSLLTTWMKEDVAEYLVKSWRLS